MKPAWAKNQSAREGRRVKISTKIGALGGNEGAHSLWIEFTYTYTVVQLRTWPKFDKLSHCHDVYWPFIIASNLPNVCNRKQRENFLHILLSGAAEQHSWFIWWLRRWFSTRCSALGEFLEYVGTTNCISSTYTSFFRYCWWQKSSMHGLGYATL